MTEPLPGTETAHRMAKRYIEVDLPWGMEDWLLPALVGFACAVVVIVIGRLLLPRRRRARPVPLPPPPANPVGPSQDPFVGGAFGEKRTSLRRQGNPVAVLISDATVTAEPYYGWVFDRSMGGLG